jgi:hypothetical protein
MSDTAAPQAVKKPLTGTLFLKETVELTPKEDGTARSMGVLQVATGDDVVRITDFSKQHENLVEGQQVRLVFEETHQVVNERPVTYRNLVTAVQS